ncbi:MAG: type III-A CRISPR-associated protein Cas10/Csm1 [Acidobacteriia bacterium]|nr:type III-A CRISPR-associated protein Cas10/Csm1 [Methyloceanibacter sp.]MCL6492686.1 type III-A CRISPR-associated protein Cas10/Csm1 [Terriglobia bacterium]
MPNLPSIEEVAVAALLHDLGKLGQRAHESDCRLPDAVKPRESVLLPKDPRSGNYSHWHVLWTDAFFDALEQDGVAFPSGLNRDRVRDLAVYHHRPQDGPTTLIAVADHLSAGLDRKVKDQKAEANPAERTNFRRITLKALPPGIDLGLGNPATAFYPARPLTTEALIPETGSPDGQGQERGYTGLWKVFKRDFAKLANAAGDAPHLFEPALIALSESCLWSVPSSTIDQPDVPLHDHSLSVAAIAACLYAHHQARGELENAEAIQDLKRPKFRLLEGDLSGIQASLFRLKSEQVQGTARILRARSFLLAALMEAMALRCREALGLPASCILLAAGGRFRMLLPERPGIAEQIEDLRQETEAWLAPRWCGDIAVNLALTEPFAPEEFHRNRLGALLAKSDLALDEAKHAPLRHYLAQHQNGVIQASFDLARGACATCGVRPATHEERRDDGESVWRCKPCDEARRIGAVLPKAAGFLLCKPGRYPDHGEVLGDLLGHYELRIAKDATEILPSGSNRAAVRLAIRFRDAAASAASAAPDVLAAPRFMANYVKVLENPEDPRFADLSEEDRKAAEAGGVMPFSHLAALAREEVEGRWVGRPLLAVLKADVDRLGFVFSRGLGADRTPGRVAALSRLMDGFFAGSLTELLRRKFPETYTVYAGGDDLLLIAPWRQGIELAMALNEEFRTFVAGNPNLTLSAGIALVHADQPLNRAVDEAEERLEAAKTAGRNRISLIVKEPVRWDELRRAWAEAGWLNAEVRQKRLGTSVLHQMLRFDDLRRRAENGEIAAARWLPLWSYAKARLAERLKSDPSAEALCTRLDLLIRGERLGKEVPARLPISIALWRNR